MILRLETGDDKLDLTYGNIFLADEFNPKTPDIDMSGINWISPNSDNLDYKDVTEIISVNVRGSCLSDMYDTITRLDRFVSRIRMNVTYLMYRPKKMSGDDTIWRSRVKSVLTTRVGPIREGDLGFYTQIDIAVTRYPYWEGDLTLASLYYGTQGNPNSQLPNTCEYVFNTTSDMATWIRNWVYVGAMGSSASDQSDVNQINGDMPTPAKIVVYNPSGVYTLSDIYLSLNTISDIPATSGSSPHVIEAEGSTYVTNIIDLGASSNNMYGKLNVPVTATTSMSASLSSQTLNQLNGNYFRVMLFFHVPPQANTVAKVTIKDSTTVLAESNNVVLDTGPYIQEMCSMRIPPFIDIDNTNLTSLTFNLSLSCTSGSYVAELDCVVLMPLNGWRKLAKLGNGIQQAYTVVDDGIDGRVFKQEPSSLEKFYTYTSYGDKIMLYPHRINQLFVMFTDVTATHNPGEYVGLSVYYRPRKITL